MCFISITKRVKNTELQPKVEKYYKAILYQKMNSNADGFCVKNPARDNFLNRTLEWDSASADIEASPLENLMCHFRIATHGEVSLLNVHGWEQGDWSFSHNGSIYSFAGTKIDKKSDSLKFFESLLRNLKNKTRPDKVAKIIQAEAEAKRFFGRATLYNKTTDDLFLFGDFRVYNLNGSYIAITSAIVNLDTFEEYFTAHGLEFERTLKNPFPYLESKFDGIAVIRNFSTEDWKFELLKKELRKWDYTSWERKDEKKVEVKTLPEPIVPPKPATEKEEIETAANLEDALVLYCKEEGMSYPPVKPDAHVILCLCPKCRLYNQYKSIGHKEDCPCIFCANVNRAQIDYEQKKKIVIDVNCLCAYCLNGIPEFCLSKFPEKSVGITIRDILGSPEFRNKTRKLF